MNFSSIGVWFQLLLFRMSRAVFYRDLAEMYTRGENIISFLEGEIAIADRTKQSARRAALRMMVGRVQGGEEAGALGHMLDGVMPRSDAMMVVAVERAEKKAEALRSMATAIEQQSKMLQVMVLYSVLPIAILPVCAALVAVLSDVILKIDQSTPIYAKAAMWTGMNGVAKFIAEVAMSYGLVIVIAFVALLVAIVVSLPRWRGTVRGRVESWPIYGAYRDFQAGMLFSALAMLLRVGTPLKVALEDVAERSSGWMRWQLQRVLDSLEDSPNAVVDAFGRGVLSPFMLGRAATLSRSSPSFSDVLVELGTKEGERVLARVTRAALMANIAVVGLVGSLAIFMGIASITVPGKFASIMEPSNLMALKAQYKSEQEQAALLGQ